MLWLGIRKRSAVLLAAVLMAAMLLAAAWLAFLAPDQAGPQPGLDLPSPYGDFLGWQEVDQLFPRYAKATVIDFESGMRFRVQRRAGSNHADVQPLTAQDSAVMKAIYGGRWSWQRKAIILELDSGRRLAASMNGMPHGAGAISGNNFRGHFCIHFRDSKTHRGPVNMAHQIMVWKAAGKIKAQLLQADQKRIIEILMAAIDQGETSLVWTLLETNREAVVLLNGITEIEALAVYSITEPENGSGTSSCIVSLGVVYRGTGREYRKKLQLDLVAEPGSWWRVKPQSVLPLLNREVWTEIIPWDPANPLDNIC